MDANLKLDEWIGKTIEVVIDRPLHSVHPRDPDIRYELNYGYVPGTIAPDGSEIDVYVLGAEEPLERCRARVIAIIRRRKDVEDKLVAVLAGDWDEESIAKVTAFQEEFWDSWIELPRSVDGTPRTGDSLLRANDLR